jgi:predicted enzyme related to lactoylglutathione lyase
MKRFHVHVSVDDLAQSIRFYSTLFSTGPTVIKEPEGRPVTDCCAQ